MVDTAVGQVVDTVEDDTVVVEIGKKVGVLSALTGDLNTLLLAIGAALGTLGSFYVGLKGVFGDWSVWVALLVLGFAGLVAVAYVWPKLVQARNRNIVSDLTIGPNRTYGEVFGLTPWFEEDSGNFSRPDKADIRFVTWLQDKAEPLLYVLGESGVGKTSLLNASAFPKLRSSASQPWEIVAVRLFDEPVEMLHRALLVAAGKGEADPPETDRVLLQELATKYAAAGKKLLLVLDQFEEVLILPESDAIDRLGAIMKDLCENPVAGLVILISMRSDYVPDMDRLPIILPSLARNWFQVKAFTSGASASYLKRVNPALTDDIVLTILKEAAEIEGSSTYFRPIVINMFGLVVSSSFATQTRGKVQRRILTEYVRNSMGRHDAGEDSRLVVRTLLTESGTKRPRKLADILRETKLDARVAVGVLSQLAIDGLVRPLDDKRQKWEISHDFVARIMQTLAEPPTPTIWTRWRGLMAPIALGMWALLVGIVALLWGPLYQVWVRSELSAAGLVETDTSSAENVSFAYNGRAVKDDVLKRGFSLMGSLVPAVRSAPVIDEGNVVSIGFFPPVPSSVEDFEAADVFNISSLSDMPSLPNLKTLNLSGSTFTDLTGMGPLPKLVTLDISGNSELSSLKGMPEVLPELTTFSFNGSYFESLEGMASMPKLTSLDLSALPLKSMEGLPEGMDALTHLTIGDQSALESLDGMPDTLPAVEQFDLVYAPNLKSLQGMSKMPLVRGCGSMPI